MERTQHVLWLNQNEMLSLMVLFTLPASCLSLNDDRLDRKDKTMASAFDSIRLFSVYFQLVRGHILKVFRPLFCPFVCVNISGSCNYSNVLALCVLETWL